MLLPGEPGGQAGPSPPGSFLLPSIRVLCSSPLNQEALGSATECDHLNSSFPLRGRVRAAQGAAEVQPANINTETWSVLLEAQRPGKTLDTVTLSMACPLPWCGENEHGAEAPDVCFLLSFRSCHKQECFHPLPSSLHSHRRFFLKLFNASLCVEMTLGIYKCDTG